MHKTVLWTFDRGLDDNTMVHLGSLTIDVVQPWTEILHPAVPLPSEHSGSTEDTKVRNTIKRAKNHSFGVFLSKLLKADIDSERSLDARLSSLKRVTQYVVNHEEAFEYLMRQGESNARVKDWIQKRVDRRQDVMMIVRMDKYVDSSVEAGRTSTSTASGELSISASQLAQGIPIPDDLTQIGARAALGKSDEETDSYEAAGGRIYAVEYRKIFWHWLPLADAASGVFGVILKSLRPGPWTRGKEGEELVANNCLAMRVEDDCPEYTASQLEDEMLEVYVDQDEDADREVEYVFSAMDEDEADE